MSADALRGACSSWWGVRLVALVLSVVASVLALAPAAVAHPLIDDRVRCTFGDGAVTLELATSLKPAVAALDAPPAGPLLSPAEIEAAFRHYERYLLERIELAVGGTRLAGRVAERRVQSALAGPIHARLEAERVRAQIRLVYPLPVERPAANGTVAAAANDAERHGALSISHALLDDRSDELGRPWQVTWALIVEGADGRSLASGLLPPGMRIEVERPVSASTAQAESLWRELGRFVRVGLSHVLSGPDHLLFVAALLLGAPALGEVWTLVLLFTLAHSLSLAAVAAGLLPAPGSWIEPLIALSIVAGAAANGSARARAMRGARFAAAFGFGLVHGLGFAAALAEALGGGSAGRLALRVGSFAVGVELAHMGWALTLYLGLSIVARRAPALRWGPVLRVGSLLVGSGGVAFLVLALRAWWNG